MNPYLIKAQFEEDAVYHVYNRANGREKLFQEAKNYTFFLEKYQKFISLIVDTYAICLIPNHFHAMVRIKSLNQILESSPPESSNEIENFSNFISRQFGRFFSSYAQSFNKIYGRTGNLFQANMKRKKVENDEYFTGLALYIHQNPVKHGLVKDIYDWPFNSFQAYIDCKNGGLISQILNKEPLLDWFGGMQNFENQHLGYTGLSSVFD